MADQASLSLTVPAAAAGLAYLNARLSVWYDLVLLRSVIPAAVKSKYRRLFDCVNQFYVLEARAKGWNRKHNFILFDNKKYTYQDTYELALKYGTWLRENFGVKPKDVVAINFMNSDHLVFWIFGLWSIGAKAALINYNLTGNALIHCVKAAATKLMIVDHNAEHNVTDEVRSGLPDLTISVFTPQVEGEVLATDGKRSDDADRSGQAEHDMALLIYTSGTTGMPKPAIVSWAKNVIGGTFTGRLISFGKNDVFYTCMPLYHSSACVLGLMNTLENGGTIAIGRRFSTKTFWKDVRRYNATIIQYVGETCRYLLAAKPEIIDGANMDKQHKVRVAFGNGLRPDVWNQFKDRFGIDTICEFYAATESSFGTFNLSSNDFSSGAIGRNGAMYNLLLGRNTIAVEVDFETDQPARDEKGFCKKVKRGEPGEMLFRLPAKHVETRFQGYYGNNKATSDKIMRDVLAKGDAWFRTGDVIRWDDQGRVYFSDRIGDTFRWKSENVSTAEVSEAVGHHPSVKEVNAYGVQLPHHDGRAGCCALILEPETEPTPQMLESIARHARATLPKYAVPLFLRVTNDGGMVMTSTHKHQKHEMRMAGVDPGKCNGDSLYWLQGDAYVPFGVKEWQELKGGRAKL